MGKACCSYIGVVRVAFWMGLAGGPIAAWGAGPGTIEVTLSRAEMHVSDKGAGIFCTFSGRELVLLRPGRLAVTRLNRDTQFRVDVRDYPNSNPPYWILDPDRGQTHAGGHRDYVDPDPTMRRIGGMRSGNRVIDVVMRVHDFRFVLRPGERRVEVWGAGVHLLAKSGDYDLDTAQASQGIYWVRPRFTDWGGTALLVDEGRETAEFFLSGVGRSGSGLSVKVFRPGGQTGTRSSGLTAEGAADSPQVPTLLSPGDGATLYGGSRDGGKPLVWDFRWSEVPGAEAYDLKVQRAGSSKAVISGVVRGTRFQRTDRGSHIVEANQGGWSWSVRAIRGGQRLPWSAARGFRFSGDGGGGDARSRSRAGKVTVTPDGQRGLGLDKLLPGLQRIPGMEGLRIQPKAQGGGGAQGGQGTQGKGGGSGSTNALPALIFPNRRLETLQ